MNQMMVEKGAACTAQDSAGNSALHWASRAGNLHGVGVLVERLQPGDLNVPNEDG